MGGKKLKKIEKKYGKNLTKYKKLLYFDRFSFVIFHNVRALNALFLLRFEEKVGQKQPKIASGVYGGAAPIDAPFSFRGHPRLLDGHFLAIFWT